MSSGTVQKINDKKRYSSDRGVVAVTLAKGGV